MDTSLRSALRCLAEWDESAAVDAGAGAPLELRGGLVTDPPRVRAAEVIEGHAVRAVRVAGDPEAGFAGFLDGTQQSRVVGYHEGIPIVHGTVAAVVRVRVNRRLFTWQAAPLVERAVYAPRRALPDALWSLLEARTERLIDTLADAEPDDATLAHPFALLDRAVHAVQERREALEERLAALWCATDGRPLFVDGGVNKSEAVARAECVAGVVKSHRTLYVEGEALQRVLRLRRGERSSVLRIARAAAHRVPVASWYLRLRDATGRDPMWGLVRVEAADPQLLGESAESLAARADRLSRWILAEVSPLALPDARWDKMVYPIRDCEEYLKAVS